MSRYELPPAEDFKDQFGQLLDFAPAPDLQAMADGLIERHPAKFGHLLQMRVEYFWKAAGGLKSGKMTLGKCQRPSGLLAHYSRADFIIWLAWDHCLTLKLEREKVEATLFHELCFPPATVVTGPRVEASMVRRYSGQMVHIRTAAGHFLAGTPNHPVLTNRGWLPLDLIHEGDYVFSSSDAERVADWMDPDKHQVPACIEQIARSGLMPLRFVPPTAEHLDAQMANGQINVVAPNRDLLADFVAALAQEVHQRPFVARGGVDLRFPDLGHPREGFGVMVLPTPRGMSGRAKAVPFIGRHPLHAQSLGSMVVAHSRAVLNKDASHDVVTDAQFFSDSALRAATGIRLDKVVRIDVGPFDGHVYNLQTSQHWYLANGIVAHNCHAGRSPEDGETPELWPHDVEMFADEVRHYGLWRSDLECLRQLGLFERVDRETGEVFSPRAYGSLDSALQGETPPRAELDGGKYDCRHPARALVDALVDTLDSNSVIDSITLSASDAGVQPVTIGRSRGTHYRDDNLARPPMVCRDPACELAHYPEVRGE